MQDYTDFNNICDEPAVREALNELGIPADHVVYGHAWSSSQAPARLAPSPRMPDGGSEKSLKSAFITKARKDSDKRWGW